VVVTICERCGRISVDNVLHDDLYHPVPRRRVPAGIDGRPVHDDALHPGDMDADPVATDGELAGQPTEAGSATRDHA
jgi:hypothetical protein